jgi:hypothetical protein
MSLAIPFSDSFVEIVSHKTNINTCEPSAIEPQQTVSAFNTRDARFESHGWNLYNVGQTRLPQQDTLPVNLQLFLHPSACDTL